MAKEKGGLGIKKLALLNRALLSKWNWRFVIEDERLWKKVIIIKYGVEEGTWYTQVSKASYGIGLWKGIRMEAGLIATHSVFVIGAGKRVHFWEDCWCDSTPLYSTFPRTIWLPLKGGGLQIFRVKMGRLGIGTRGLQDPSTIGKWKRCAVSYLPYGIKEPASMRRIK